VSDIRPEPGSYRDPGGRVLHVDERILRTVMPVAAEDYEKVRATGLVNALIADGLVVAERALGQNEARAIAVDASYVLEHPRLPFISHPYEWPFPALKAAALLHLDIHLRALKHDVTLSDASAYNIQFQGVRPVFIDHLSFKPYQPGQYWLAHRQFCEQFLNPLLLRSLLGVTHNAWYRGAVEGIATVDLARMLPMRKKLSWHVLTQVLLQASLQNRSARMGDAAKVIDSSRRRPLPKASFQQMLRSLRNWISKLHPADTGKTVWQDYDQQHSYGGDEVLAKRNFVTQFSAQVKPQMLWDIGCNTGEFSAAVLQADTHAVIGLDVDQGALEKAFARAQQDELNLLPLYMDLSSPSPEQGWEQRERAGLAQRAQANAITALALIHHLAIARNIPLAYVVRWLVSLAPQGVIEFVPKTDPMVGRLLALREDIFTDYDEPTFIAALCAQARIVKRQVISTTGRELFWFSRE
jgi:ribosomal protein L11 methylase PrmA